MLIYQKGHTKTVQSPFRNARARGQRAFAVLFSMTPQKNSVKQKVVTASFRWTFV